MFEFRLEIFLIPLLIENFTKSEPDDPTIQPYNKSKLANPQAKKGSEHESITTSTEPKNF